MQPAAPTLPSTRLGPDVINPIATAAIINNQSLNSGRPAPVNTSIAPSITIGLTWSSTGVNAVNPTLPAMKPAHLDDLRAPAPHCGSTPTPASVTFHPEPPPCSPLGKERFWTT